MTIEEKVYAVNAYTKDSINTLLSKNVDVQMVQIGNETTSGIAGEYTWTNMAKIFNAGSSAIREINSEKSKQIKVALHFTNPEKSGKYAEISKNLFDNGVDYDVFASSYYPYWHGTLAK